MCVRVLADYHGRCLSLFVSEGGEEERGGYEENEERRDGRSCR